MDPISIITLVSSIATCVMHVFLHVKYIKCFKSPNGTDEFVLDTTADTTGGVVAPPKITS